MRLAELKALAPQLHALLEKYGASKLAVFSIDLLVDLPEQASLFDRADLKLALEELLNQSVDLIRRQSGAAGHSFHHRSCPWFPHSRLRDSGGNDHLQDALLRCLEVMGKPPIA